MAANPYNFGMGSNRKRYFPIRYRRKNTGPEEELLRLSQEMAFPFDKR